MPKAIFNGGIIAETSTFEEVEGNIYFPAESVDQSYLTPSDTTTFCPWKGTAHYYDVTVKGKTAKDAAWYYPETKEAANNIKGYLAFWKGVEVKKE